MQIIRVVIKDTVGRNAMFPASKDTTMRHHVTYRIYDSVIVTMEDTTKITHQAIQVAKI